MPVMPRSAVPSATCRTTAALSQRRLRTAASGWVRPKAAAAPGRTYWAGMLDAATVTIPPTGGAEEVTAAIASSRRRSSFCA